MFSPSLLCGMPPKDRAQRMKAGLTLDASQRTPPQGVAQRMKAGLSIDASQRTPPQHVVQHASGAFRRMGGGDASQRSPAPNAGGAWGAASASVAATRAAALAFAAPSQTMPGEPSAPAAASVAEAAMLAQVALAAVDTLEARSHASATVPCVAVAVAVPVAVAASAAVPCVQSATVPTMGQNISAVNQAQMSGTGPVDRDRVVDMFWLAGISKDSTLCSKDLTERLLAAMPETYDD